MDDSDREPWFQLLKPHIQEKYKEIGTFDYEDEVYRSGRDGEERSMEDMGDGDNYVGEFKP